MYQEDRRVRIINASRDRNPRMTDVYDVETGAKLLDVYRAIVTIDGEDHEVTRRVALASDYEGMARLYRGYPERS